VTETQFLAPTVATDEDELDRSAQAAPARRLRRQERVKEQLAIALEAATARGEALDHVLLVGPPGLGKTSLAFIIREELGVGIRTVAGPALERKGDMAAILTVARAARRPLRRRDPPLNRAIEEILYPALEDFRLDIVVGQAPRRGRSRSTCRLHARRRDHAHRPADDAAPRTASA
jgi:Holliday junction DNA helicase RuvB